MGHSGFVHMPAVIADEFGLSRSEARRLIVQGGVMLNGDVMNEDDFDLPRSLVHGQEIRVGRRRRATVEFSTSTARTPCTPDKDAS